ncbi:MAG: AbrB/MazE/SpoVT family DNA-binding domain-containing protein [Candidatus Saccharimonadales bacterium]
MITKNVTITSKNQITLPSEYVNLLQLAQNRVLLAELRGGKIILSPQPDLAEAMQQFWGKHSAKRPLTESELKLAVRSSVAGGASKNI